MRDFILDLVKKDNVIWYVNGHYQRSTPMSCQTINIFDKETKIIVVFQKQSNGSNLFLTTCELTGNERNHLIDTNRNFLTEAIIKQQKALIPIKPITIIQENDSTTDNKNN